MSSACLKNNLHLLPGLRTYPRRRGTAASSQNAQGTSLPAPACGELGTVCQRGLTELVYVMDYVVKNFYPVQREPLANIPVAVPALPRAALKTRFFDRSLQLPAFLLQLFVFLL